MKRFEEFIKDEYEFIYDDCENAEVILNGFDISKEMREKIEMDLFDKIIPVAIEGMMDNDFFWQTLHEEMDDFLIGAIKDYMANLE